MLIKFDHAGNLATTLPVIEPITEWRWLLNYAVKPQIDICWLLFILKSVKLFSLPLSFQIIEFFKKGRVMSSYKIALIVGSSRKESINQLLGLALTKLAPSSLSFEPIAIDDLPMYHGDPFDRLIVAQALMTHDKILPRYSDTIIQIWRGKNLTIWRHPDRPAGE